MNSSDKFFWLWLTRVQSLNCIQKNKLLEQYGTPEKIWQLGTKELEKLDYINNKDIADITNKDYRKDLDKYFEYMEKNNIRMINVTEDTYPRLLKNIYDRPIVIFTIGDLKNFDKKCVAIVGCRDCSNYGKNVTLKFAKELSQKDVCIVSGLAKGIDAYAHKGAITERGKTIAVLGNGLDYVYPYQNKGLFDEIINNGGLIISEYIIGTRPTKLNFPARNRIISGISNAIIVTEAKGKSGALITADFGLEQGREIFAVPGDIFNGNSIGVNELIKQGANVLTDYTEVLDVIN